MWRLDQEGRCQCGCLIRKVWLIDQEGRCQCGGLIGKVDFSVAD